MQKMRVFRVGGCVRDHLLGRKPSDEDYVVVDESPESMKAKGFQQVGTFPVFLHPETGDEYALARLDNFSPEESATFAYQWQGVTLEDDLYRRDLTVNALAMDEDGHVIDHFGGVQDIHDKVLRHVSLHFAVDPLRILRVARFAAKLDFTVAGETLALMTRLVKEGTLSTIAKPRIWQEFRKALLTDNPGVFLEVLSRCGALEVLMPGIEALKGVVQRPDYHAEGDVYTHTMMVLDEAVQLSGTLPEERALRIRFAALTHDLGKAFTAPEFLHNPDGTILGKHPGHDDPEVFKPALERICHAMGIPNALKRFAYHCALGHQNIHRIRDLSGKGLVCLYDDLGLKNQMNNDPDILEDIGLVCRADNLGRRNLGANGTLVQPVRYRQEKWFIQAMSAIHALPIGEWMKTAMDKNTVMEHALAQVLGQRRKAGVRIARAITEEAQSAVTKPEV